MPHDQHSFDLSPSDPPELEPIICQLANGHAVRIEAGYWSRWRTLEEWVSETRPEPYFAIRVYCTEDMLPQRMVWVEEFCEETEFQLHDFDNIWQWLGDLCKSREVFAFDDLTEFLDHVSDAIIQFSTAEPDAVEHIERLSEFTDPDAFDRSDDSLYNDQNE
jgi:hypothetical protein